MPAKHRSDLTVTQNFLRSRRLVGQLIRHSGIGPDDLVVEIGPGKGIITEQLAASCRQVLAIEKDPVLARGLRQRLAGRDNVALFETDVLAFPLPISAYKVFANIPFNVTSAIIGKLTGQAAVPEDAFLIVQAEAAARFLGEPRESLVALLLKPWFEPTILHRFRRHDFMPAPRVDVVMLRLKKRGPPLVPSHQARQYRDFVTAICTAWQPTVQAALTSLAGKSRAHEVARRTALNLDRPPLALPFEAWLTLFEAYVSMPRSGQRGQVIAGAEERLQAHQRRLRKVHRTRAVAVVGSVKQGAHS